MARQRTVQERERRVDDVEDAPILLDDRLDEQSSSLSRIASSSSSSTVGKRSGSGLVRPRLRSCSHCAAQLSTRLYAFGSASIRRTCASSTGGRAQRPGLGQLHQLRIGHARPQEIREPRRQLDVADRAGWRSDRASIRNRKFGDARIACSASRMPSWNVSPSRCASVTRPASPSISSSVTGRR